MRTDRTSLGDFLSFKDVTTIPAVPFHRSLLFECLSFPYIFQQIQVPGLVEPFHLSHLAEGFVSVTQSFRLGCRSEILVELCPFKIFTSSCRLQIVGKCNETGICVIKDDMLEIHKKILEAEAIIHSVPVYFWAMTSQMKAYLDRWCVFFDADWQWHKAYHPKMKGKKISLITLCGDSNVSTADPIVHSFRSTCQFSGLNFLGLVQASASTKGEISKNEGIKKQAYDLGRKSVTG